MISQQGGSFCPPQIIAMGCDIAMALERLLFDFADQEETWNERSTIDY